MSTKKMICINCPLGCEMEITIDAENIKVTGNTCRRGLAYAENEVKDPKRVVTTTAKVSGGESPVVPVKTDKEISKNLMLQVVSEVNAHTFIAPIYIGDILIENLFNTGVNIVATGTVQQNI